MKNGHCYGIFWPLERRCFWQACWVVFGERYFLGEQAASRRGGYSGFGYRERGWCFCCRFWGSLGEKEAEVTEKKNGGRERGSWGPGRHLVHFQVSSRWTIHFFDSGYHFTGCLRWFIRRFSTCVADSSSVSLIWLEKLVNFLLSY